MHATHFARIPRTHDRKEPGLLGKRLVVRRTTTPAETKLVVKGGRDVFRTPRQLDVLAHTSLDINTLSSRDAYGDEYTLHRNST